MRGNRAVAGARGLTLDRGLRAACAPRGHCAVRDVRHLGDRETQSTTEADNKLFPMGRSGIS